MFCSNCGAEIRDGKFCSECGAPIQEKTVQQANFKPGHPIKMCLNCGERLLEKAKKCTSCNADARDYPVIDSNDIEQINQIKMNAPHNEYKKSLWDRSTEQANAAHARKQQNTNVSEMPQTAQVSPQNNTACCPKCGSTSLSANKKGFGIGKAVVGAALTGGIGLIAGNIGAKKVIVTCLNCGNQWKV